MRKIVDAEGEILAIVFKLSDFMSQGVNFISDLSWDFQIAIMAHPKGHEISRHHHPKQKREIFTTSEILIIFEGSINADIFDSHNQFMQSIPLEAGHVIFLKSGGHGFTVSENAKFMELKQGPYNSTLDKVLF